MVDYHLDGTEKAAETEAALREYFTTEKMSRMSWNSRGELVRFWCPTELTPEQMFIVETITGLKYRKAGSRT